MQHVKTLIIVCNFTQGTAKPENV